MPAFTFSDYTSKGYNISRFGSERDGSRATVLSAKAGVDVTPNLNVEGVFRLTDRAVNTDPQDFNCVFDPVTFTCPPVNPTTFGLVVDGNDRTTFKSTAGRFGATYTLFDGAWVQSANVKRYDDRLRGYSEGFLRLRGRRHAHDVRLQVRVPRQHERARRHGPHAQHPGRQPAGQLPLGHRRPALQEGAHRPRR